jgi:hypothetical protein
LSGADLLPTVLVATAQHLVLLQNSVLLKMPAVLLSLSLLQGSGVALLDTLASCCLLICCC